MTIFVVQSDESSLTDIKSPPIHGGQSERDEPLNKSQNEMLKSRTISFSLLWGLIKFRIQNDYSKK